MAKDLEALQEKLLHKYIQDKKKKLSDELDRIVHFTHALQLQLENLAKDEHTLDFDCLEQSERQVKEAIDVFLAHGARSPQALHFRQGSLSHASLYKLHTKLCSYEKLVESVNRDCFERVLKYGEGRLNWIGSQGQFWLFTKLLPLHDGHRWKSCTKLFSWRGKDFPSRYTGDTPSAKNMILLIDIMRWSFSKNLVKEQIKNDYTLSKAIKSRGVYPTVL
ncbi:hypothetical protein [Endozoicomonas sp. SESOKO1]|uniref:hypothetical protein n=1 Tax=Endozoicomonas sp. SESOKO1 TaxID=2828742 RepID=UPI002148A38B|nr:hypothetical protein [Endozoicomonas sp. SESOKO1]